MDKGKVVGGSEGGEEAVEKSAIERVTVEAEDLERTRAGGRGRGEEGEEGRLGGGGEAQDGECDLAEVRGAEVGEEEGEEGVPQLGVAGEIYLAEVGLVEGCCEFCYNPWVRLGMTTQGGVRWVNTGRRLYRMCDNLPGSGSETRGVSDTMLVDDRVAYSVHSGGTIPLNAGIGQYNYR